MPRPHATRSATAALLTLLLVAPIRAYDGQLSESTIRDAYFLGIRQGGLPTGFLAKYAHWLPDLKEGTCTSEVRLETPFLQVAEYASKVPNYSAQDAVKHFRDMSLPLRIHLDICYRQNAPLNALHMKIVQNKKELLPSSTANSPYCEPTDNGCLPPNGERIDLEFDPAKIDSSDLTIFIDTRDDQHAATNFDLRSLR
jgi:hypothetical protein